MALNLDQIDKVFDPALVLPIGGREYRVEDLPALLGLYCQRVWTAGIAVAQAAMVGDGDEKAATAALDGLNALPPPPGVPDGTPLHVAVLGDTYQRMLDDGVSARWIQHAGMTVIAWAWTLSSSMHPKMRAAPYFLASGTTRSSFSCPSSKLIELTIAFPWQ